MHLRDEFGWTPLHWACMKHYIQVVKILIEYSSDKDSFINETDLEGNTALFCCQGTFLCTYSVDVRQCGMLSSFNSLWSGSFYPKQTWKSSHTTNFKHVNYVNKPFDTSKNKCLAC